MRVLVYLCVVATLILACNRQPHAETSAKSDKYRISFIAGGDQMRMEYTGSGGELAWSANDSVGLFITNAQKTTDSTIDVSSYYIDAKTEFNTPCSNGAGGGNIFSGDFMTDWNDLTTINSAYIFGYYPYQSTSSINAYHNAIFFSLSASQRQIDALHSGIGEYMFALSHLSEWSSVSGGVMQFESQLAILRFRVTPDFTSGTPTYDDFNNTTNPQYVRSVTLYVVGADTTATLANASKTVKLAGQLNYLYCDASGSLLVNPTVDYGGSYNSWADEHSATVTLDGDIVPCIASNRQYAWIVAMPFTVEVGQKLVCEVNSDSYSFVVTQSYTEATSFTKNTISNFNLMPTTATLEVPLVQTSGYTLGSTTTTTISATLRATVELPDSWTSDYNQKLTNAINGTYGFRVSSDPQMQSGVTEFTNSTLELSGYTPADYKSYGFRRDVTIPRSAGATTYYYQAYTVIDGTIYSGGIESFNG